jgi:hypothetical protein
MDRTELYRMVADRPVENVYWDLCDQLSRCPPDGATTHRRDPRRQSFLLAMDEASSEHKGETFKGYRERDPTRFEKDLDEIFHALATFGLHL